MTADRLLTMRQLHTELFSAHRKLLDQGFGRSEKLMQLIERVGKEIQKYPSGWGHTGTGADMPMTIGAWEMQFSGVLTFIPE